MGRRELPCAALCCREEVSEDACAQSPSVPHHSPPLWRPVHPLLGASVDGVQSLDCHKAHTTSSLAWAPDLTSNCLGPGATWTQLNDPPCHPQELLTKGAVTNCMTYFGCQSYNGNILHLAPTVYKIFRKFDDVANFVISSCLGAPSMTAQDRAQVVEFWIRVAKVCHGTAPRVHPASWDLLPSLANSQDGFLRSDPARTLGPSCQGRADLDLQAPGVGQPSLAPSLG